jgi:hypothetical protein
MTASDYGVTTPYGQIPGYPLNGGYHSGEDRIMPINTPIVINNTTTIGFSGNSGSSTGAHLHIGRFMNGQPTNPQGRGFTLPAPAIVTDTGQDATNGKYVGLRDAQGVRWVYCHLNVISVSKNQVIQAGEDPAVIAQLQEQVAQLTQQTHDMQSQIDIMRPDLVDSHNRIDGLNAEIQAERVGYENAIAVLQDQLKQAQIPAPPAPTATAKPPSKFWAAIAKLFNVT